MRALMGNLPSVSMGNYLRASSAVIGHNPTMDMDAIRLRFQTALERSGLDMKSASKKAGLGETFVRDFLQRGRDPSISNLFAAATATGVSVIWLLTGEDRPLSEFPSEFDLLEEDEKEIIGRQIRGLAALRRAL